MISHKTQPTFVIFFTFIVWLFGMLYTF